jgi:hypothetical protein
MSQSYKLTREFGQVVVGPNAINDIKLGNTNKVLIRKTPAPVALTNASVTLTTNQLLTGLLVGAPATADKTLTLPSAELLVAAIENANVGDTFEYSVVNTGVGDGIQFVVATGTGGTNVGHMSVDNVSGTDVVGGGSAMFRVRLTNVTSGAEAYTNTRIA